MNELSIPPGIAQVPDYVPVVPAAPPGTTEARMFLNESPTRVPDGLRRHLSAHLTALNRYPGILPVKLIDRIAAEHDVDPSQVVVGAGSVAIYHQVADAILGPHDKVVYPWPSFESYPIVCSLSGAEGVAVPLTTVGATDPAGTLANAGGARVVMLCEPNNPTGAAIGADSLLELVSGLDPTCLIVVDQAYIEFQDEADRAGIAALLQANHNVLVLRTFSKAHGLAGLRVGYGITTPHVAAALRKATIPCSVSAMGEAAAIWCLNNPQHTAQHVAQTILQRARIQQDLAEQGWHTTYTQTNFVWVETERAADISVALQSEGILVRAFPGSGLRITVGSPQQNLHLIHTMKRLAGGHDAPIRR